MKMGSGSGRGRGGGTRKPYLFVAVPTQEEILFVGWGNERKKEAEEKEAIFITAARFAAATFFSCTSRAPDFFPQFKWMIMSTRARSKNIFRSITHPPSAWTGATAPWRRSR